METPTKINVRNLRVYYDGPQDSKLDFAIEEAVKPFGFRFWAAGFSLEEGVRDLAFDNKPDLNEIFSPQELADLSAESAEPYIFCRDSQGNLTTKKNIKNRQE